MRPRAALPPLIAALSGCTLFTGAFAPLCGNGLIDESDGAVEACDDGNRRDGDGCSAACALEALCGDGVRQAAEECDGQDLGGESCASVDPGFVGGALACDPATCGFDTAGCQAAVCGNGLREPPTEECDGADLAGQDCQDRGFVGGALACDPATCDFDTAGCDDCGNNTVDPGEICDGNDLDGESCASLGLGFTGGDLACQVGCGGFDIARCVGEANCQDNADDDADGEVDCDDPECAATCAGPACDAAVPLTGDVTVQGSNVGHSNSENGRDGPGFSTSCFGSGAGDVAYVVTPPVTGSVTIGFSFTAQNTGFPPPGLGYYVRAVCDDPSTQTQCPNAAPSNSFLVSAGQPFAIIVDGDNNGVGTFTLSLDFTAQ